MADRTLLDNSTHAQKPLATWRAAFVKALATNANVSAAARAAEVARSWAYECRANDASFAEEWDEALVTAVEDLEERAWRRANFADIQYQFTKDGSPVLHPVTGEPYYLYVGSDTVLLRLLEAHKPDVYKQRSAVDVNATVKTEPKYDLSKLSPADLLLARELQRKLLANQEGGEHGA
jgi:hypothetical protein